jgi:hypothetical protein
MRMRMSECREEQEKGEEERMSSEKLSWRCLQVIPMFKSNFKIQIFDKILQVQNFKTNIIFKIHYEWQGINIAY